MSTNIPEIEKAQQSQAEQFDKAILTVSSALFGLSVAFIKDVAAEPPQAICLVALAWCALASSILCTLYSFLASQHALRHNIRVLRGQASGNPPELTSKLNYWSFSLFLAGLLLFILFCVVNIMSDEKKPTEPKQEASQTEGIFEALPPAPNSRADGISEGYQPQAVARPSSLTTNDSGDVQKQEISKGFQPEPIANDLVPPQAREGSLPPAKPKASDASADSTSDLVTDDD